MQEAALNAAFEARMAALRKEYAAASEETKRHLESQILPGIAAYETLQVVMPKEEALETVHSYVEVRAWKLQKVILKLMRIPGLNDRLEKEKKPCIFVGLVCVPAQYQGQGYMRRVMDIAFAEGDRLGVPVVLETDAKSKRDRYIHLGMELAGTRTFGDFGFLYDMVRYPKTQ